MPAVDAEKRRPGAKPGQSFDIDGDGIADPVFRSCYSDNCDYLMYQRRAPRVHGTQRDDCATFLGEITAAVMQDPLCAKPSVNGRPCRLETRRSMIHGELQEEFYEVVGGKYEQVGTGELIGPREPVR